MIYSLNHHSVNWVDGMQISAAHYAAQEKFIADSLRDVASFHINRFNYGLLPVEGLKDAHSIFDIYATGTNAVQLRIRNCHAVTAAGHRIAMTDVDAPVSISSIPDTTQAKEAAAQFYVLITVDPFDRVPAGDLDTQEIPPRRPYVQPRYQVQLVSVNDMSSGHTSGNYLVAGKVIFHEGIIKVDTSFIPPCTTVSSHPQLLRCQQDFVSSIAQLQQHAMTILRKAHHKNQHPVITACVTSMCHTMLNQFSNSYFQLRNVAPEMPPVYMIGCFSGLAHDLYTCIHTMQDADKETSLNYCAEWSAVTPHTLLNTLSAVIEINYNHYKTGEYMELIQSLLTGLKSIWEKLAGLDYLGQQHESIIVNEQAITKTVRVNKGWSPFD